MICIQFNSLNFLWLPRLAFVFLTKLGFQLPKAITEEAK
jgi:hypothetical protein